MKSTKKLISMLLVISLVIVLIAACSSGNNTANNTNGTSTPAPATPATPSEPAEDEVPFPESLTYWVPMNPNEYSTMQSYAEKGNYKGLELATGTKVEFLHPSGEGAQIIEQLNLLLASRNLPDVIETNWVTIPRGPDDAINSGTIIRLNELIAEHAPNFRAYLDQNPEVETSLMTDEGNLYAFPFLRGDPRMTVFHGPILRKDILDQVNMEVPTTIDEWEAVLTAFRDANNGTAPFIINLAHTRVGQAFIGAFGISLEFYNDNGTVKYGSVEPAYLDYLTTMNRWYENGLLDADFAAFDGQLFDSKVTGSQALAFTGYTGSGIGKFMGLMENDPNFQLIGVPYPTLNKGDTPLFGQQDFTYPGIASAAITTAAENPEQIVRWLDFAYSPEGHLLFNFGIEGESYEMIDGYPTYTDAVLNHPSLPATQALFQYIRAVGSGPFIQDFRYFEQYLDLPEQMDAINNWVHPTNEMKMPLVTPTADESRRFASIMSDINVYHEEMFVRFIMGSEPLSNFDSYIETMKSLGIEEAIEIQQVALERYLAR